MGKVPGGNYNPHEPKRFTVQSRRGPGGRLEDLETKASKGVNTFKIQTKDLIYDLEFRECPKTRGPT